MITSAERWERERLIEALDSYNRGLADAPYLRKWTDGPPPAPSTQSGQSGQRPGPSSAAGAGIAEKGHMTFVVSTGEVDRHGDTISVKGWELKAYRRNPVFLWAHNYSSPAIGRAMDVWKEDHGLLARIEFAPTQFAQEVAGLYSGGYQRGVSVGFRPLRYEIRRDTQTGEFLGINFIEQELLEISAAPVPANQSALRKALDATPLLRSYYLGDLDAEGDLQQILDALRSAREPA